MPCITHSFFIKYQNIQSSECETNFTKLICQSAYNTTSLTGLHCHTVVSSKAFHYAQVLEKLHKQQGHSEFIINSLIISNTYEMQMNNNMAIATSLY